MLPLKVTCCHTPPLISCFLSALCRCKPKLKLRIINQNSVSVLQTPGELDPPTEQDHSRGQRSHTTPSSPVCAKAKENNTETCSVPPGDLDCEIKSDSSPDRDHVHDDDITKETAITEGNKKRKRKPYRPGEEGPDTDSHMIIRWSCFSVIQPVFISAPCLRHRGVHGASTWGEDGSQQNQIVQKRLVGHSARSRRG